MRVLVTRPAEDAADFAEALAARGHEAVLEPLLEITPAEPAALPVDLDAFQALLITSANGLRAFAALTQRRELPVYTVGAASAEAARAAGFAEVESAGGDVEDLVRLVRERLKPEDGVLLHAAGKTVAGDLKGALEAVGFTVTRAVLYTAEAATALSPGVLDDLRQGRLEAVALFSPRTAETFAELLQAAGLAGQLGGLRALCLSRAVAAKLGRLTLASVELAERPETGALLDLLDRAAGGARDDKDEGMADQDSAQPQAEAEPPAVQLIGRFGGIRPMAQKLGVAVSTVQGWRERGAVPPGRLGQIRAAAAANNIEIPEAELEAAAKRGPGSVKPAAVATAVPKAAIGTNKATDDKPPSEKPPSEKPPSEKPKADKPAIEKSPTDKPEGKPAEAEAKPRSSMATGAARRDTLKPAPEKEEPGGTFALATGGWLFGFILGALVFLGGLGVAVLSRGTWLPLVQDPVVAGPSEASAVAPGSDLEARLKSLEGAIADAEARGASGEVERLTRDITALRGGLQSLQSEVEGVRDDGGSDLEALLADVTRRLDGLGRQVEGIDSRTATAGDLRAELGLLAARLAAIEQRMGALPRVGADGRIALPEDAAFVLAVAQLRDALRFSEPFETELGALQRLAAEDEEMAAALDRLAPQAAAGIPTFAALQSGFPEVARAIAVAGAGGDSESWLAGVKRRLSELVTVRPVGADVEGEAAAAIAARAEALVAAGDLPGALEELASLSDMAGAAAAEWRAQAEARLEAEAAVRLFSARVVDRLAPSLAVTPAPREAPESPAEAPPAEPDPAAAAPPGDAVEQ